MLELPLGVDGQTSTSPKQNKISLRLSPTKKKATTRTFPETIDNKTHTLDVVERHRQVKFLTCLVLCAIALWCPPVAVFLSVGNETVQPVDNPAPPLDYSYNSEEDESTSFVRQNDSNYTEYPTEIRFIGERHSGTNWMFDHLSECFGDDIFIKSSYSRWKHWFQEDKDSIQNTLVIAQFRDPYDWVEAMRKKPHHSPNHVGLEWNEFVTRPWTMPQWMLDDPDNNTMEEKDHSCLQGFTKQEIFPCKAPKNFRHVGWWPPRYELRRDRSGMPYGSVVELRRDKIQNFVEIANFESVKDFLVVRYEDAVNEGTADLIQEIESKTGIKAKCTPCLPRETTKPKEKLDPEFIEWMDSNVDWETERLIGYTKREAQKTTKH